jgi:hypothetical protein
MFRQLKFATIAMILFLTHAVGQKLDEYQVKAAFILNFANFIEWPAAAFTGSDDPFDICVLGSNPFGHTLESLVEGKVVDRRAFVVRYVADVRNVGGCHILFISSSERLRFRSILGGLKNSSVLPVGDTSDFIAEGGVVDFRLESGKVRIEIDAKAAREKNLRISSRLLGLSKTPK